MMKYFTNIMFTLLILMACVAAYHIRAGNKYRRIDDDGVERYLKLSESADLFHQSPTIPPTPNFMPQQKYCETNADCYNMSSRCRCAVMNIGPKQCKCLVYRVDDWGQYKKNYIKNLVVVI